MFYCLDGDGDGFISIAEWKFHYAAMGILLEYAQASFDAMDKDGDGKITMDEFLNYHIEYFCSAENELNSAILYGPL